MEHNRSPPRFLFYLSIINKEGIKVKGYKYDYKRSSFKEEKSNGDNVNVKFTKIDRLKITNLDYI